MATFSSRAGALTLAFTVGLTLSACGGGSAQQAAGGSGDTCDVSTSYPRGPVELIVPWAAGGGTDSVARFLGAELAEKLDTQVNVVNRDGGSGVVGHSAIAAGKPDGSTIGLATVEITMMHWQGLTDLDHEDLTPVAQVNSDPAGITVRADAPWDSVEDLVADAKQDPGSIKASGTGRGGIWDLARAGLLVEAGADPSAIRWVPSDGAAPALQELVAGGVDVSTASLVENRTMLEEGRVKALGVMGPERLSDFPKVPTLAEQGVDFEMAAWRGIAGPAGMDEQVVEELACHFEDIVQSKDYENFMHKSGFGIAWRGPEEFASYMAEQDAEKGELMKKAGLTG